MFKKKGNNLHSKSAMAAGIGRLKLGTVLLVKMKSQSDHDVESF